MHPRYRLLTIFTVITVVLGTAVAMAGWGDALKQAGSEYADQGAKAAGLPYSPSEAVQGIKEVLSLGTDYATSSLDKPGGFSLDPATMLSLPSSLNGLGDTTNLLSALNGAAEGSVPKTGNVFMDAIQGLAVGDYSTLLGGSEDAITRFFESSSRATLKKLVKPIVGKSVEASGVDTYLAPLMAAQSATNVSGPPFDATEYLTDRTLDGMFFYMAAKEKDIRASNGAGTTDLLQKLF